MNQSPLTIASAAGRALGGSRRRAQISAFIGLPAGFCALLACAIPTSAQAQTTLAPYAEVQVEHDSNVFKVPNSQTLLSLTGNTRLGDTDEKYIAGVNGTAQWSRQKLTAMLEFRHQNFDHYTNLNHNEYLLDTSLDWKLTHLFDGVVEFRQESKMALFELGNSYQLTRNKERLINAHMNVNFAPEWRLGTGVYFRRFDTPLQFYPKYFERDVGSHLALDYLGFSKLTYGIALDRIDGKLENAPFAGPFTQNTAQLTTTYTVSALTTLNAAAGFTRRTANAIQGGNASGFTGQLGYTRQLTGKTSVYVTLSRLVNTYAATAGAVVDSVAALGVTWQATYRLGLNARYSFTRSAFQGQNLDTRTIPPTIIVGRVDRFATETLNVNYQLFSRFSLRAYANRQQRNSTVANFDYTDTTYGLDGKWVFR